jgi:uncharacterized repeat protein (TIGR02543 family)
MRKNNMKKTAARISALFMAVCLTFTYAGPLQINASGPGLAKDSTGAYLISSADDLNTFADWVNDGNDCDDDTIKLTADIIARDDFPIIGQYGFWSNDYFEGTFDGQGHAITVNINSDNNFVGLFGCIREASIKNLTLNGSVTGDNDTTFQDNATGGICGFVQLFSDDGGVPFENCVNNASVTGYGKVGGIVGNNTTKGDYDNIYSCVNCTNNGNITALDGADSGGIIGIGSTCINCVNTGNITGDESYAGGIIGRGHNVQIYSCQNRGTVFSGDAAGGIVGYANFICKYYGCSNLGSVRSTGNYFGGIIGFSDYHGIVKTEMNYCYNLADLGSVSPHYVGFSGFGYGGLVGCANNNRIISFQYCYTINGTSANQHAVASDFIGISDGLPDTIRYNGCFTLSEYSDVSNLTALSEEQFSSGEACYLLNRRITYDGFTNWTTYHQTLNDTVTSTGIKKTDEYPNLSDTSYIVSKNADGTYYNADSNRVLTGTASNGTVKVQALSNGVYVDVAGRHIEKGTTVKLTAAPDTYCNLTGWTEQTAAGQTAVTYVRTGNSITFTMPDRDVKFTPVFERQKYTVTFNANNGTGTMGNQEFEYGIAEKLNTNTFTRPGYTFLGWSTEKSTEAAAYSDKQSITKISSNSTVKNVTLYAVWKADADAYLTYTSGDANMGTTSRIYDTCTHGLESNPAIADVTAVPNAGYHFVRWYDYTNYDYTNKQDVSTDATLTADQIKAQAYNGSIYKTTAFVAYFEANTYTVEFNANNGTGTKVIQKFKYGTAETLTANAFTYENHIFVGWATEAGGAAVYSNAQSVENLTSANNGTVKLYAVWADNSDVVLSYMASDAAMGGVTFASQALSASGTASGSTAVAGDGYSFVNWTDKDGKEVGTSEEYVPEKSDGSYVTALYTANFKANTYKVVFDDGVDDSSVSGTMADQILTYDKKTNLNTNGFTRKGYVFGGWYVDGVTPVQLYKDGASVMNLTSVQGAEVTLKAVWTKLPDAELSYSSGNEEHGSVSTATEIVDPYGTPDGASASAADGYHFVNWTDANGKEVSTEASFKPAAEDYYVTASYAANFEANTYLIVFNANEGADSMDDQIMTYDKTEKLAANTITRPGYVFTGWNTSSDGTGTAYDNEASISNLTEEQGAKIDLYAQWTSLSDITITYISANRTMGKTLRAYDAINPETGVPAGSAAEAKTGYRFVSWTYDDQVVTTSAKLTAAQVAANARGNDGYVTGVFTANFEAVKGTDDTPDDNNNNNSNQGGTNVVDDGYVVPDTSVKQ